jgi:hypothetical protein
MRIPSGRLLITLVLLAVASTAAWTTAHARPREGALGGRSCTSASVMIRSYPGMRPASGEPDVGATKNPPFVTGRTQIVEDEETIAPGSNWFPWISRIWMARYLGVR